jgi:hypothetical protein
MLPEGQMEESKIGSRTVKTEFQVISIQLKVKIILFDCKYQLLIGNECKDP